MWHTIVQAATAIISLFSKCRQSNDDIEGVNIELNNSYNTAITISRRQDKKQASIEETKPYRFIYTV